MSTTPIILLILKALEGRNAERMVTTLAYSYVERGYSVHVLCITQQYLGFGEVDYE